jgi:hypothetical protein
MKVKLFVPRSLVRGSGLISMKRGFGSRGDFAGELHAVTHCGMRLAVANKGVALHSGVTR